MNKNDELFDLIRSLSGSEKRYFRLFCQQQRSAANYLKLFDAIAAREVYNEKEIRKKFENEKFMNQLHVTKNYLRTILLRALRNYHAGISRKAALADLLRNIEILYNKELYHLCGKEIEKAEKTGRQYQLDVLLLEVYQWKRKLTQAVTPFDVSAISEAVGEEEQALMRVNNTFTHKKKNVDIYRSFLSAGPRPGKVVPPGNVPEAAKAETIEGTVYLYHSRYYQHIAGGAYERAEAVLYELIALLEEQPHLVEEDPGLYVSTINNFLSYMVFSRQYEKALQLVEQAKTRYLQWQLDSRTRVLLRQVLRTYNIELEIRRDQQRKSVQPVPVEDIEAFLVRHEEKAPVDYTLLFWYQLASIYFMQRKYTLSLKWINKVLNAGQRKVRPDVQVYARILNLMVHLELKNLFVLGYYVDSTRRYLKKNKVYDDWKKELLRFFSLLRKTPEYELKPVFRSFRDRFFPANDQAVIAEEVLDYIDLRKWITERSL